MRARHGRRSLDEILRRSFNFIACVTHQYRGTHSALVAFFSRPLSLPQHSSSETMMENSVVNIASRPYVVNEEEDVSQRS